MVELLDRGRVARLPRDYILVSTIRKITIVICILRVAIISQVVNRAQSI